MSKDARNEDLDFSPGEREPFDSLVSLLAQRGFGKQGPPRETTFAQIEQFGHQAGRMVARAVDAHLAHQHAHQHAEHFAGAEPCPSCGEQRRPKEKPHDLPLQTSDGEVGLHEPACHCPICRRAFFPVTHRVAD